MQLNDDAPFFYIDPSNLIDTAKNMYEGFINYIKALIECIKEKMPDVLNDAEKLPAEVQDI
jgi:hypothetical protein